MSSNWYKPTKWRTFPGPFPHSYALIGRQFDQKTYDAFHAKHERDCKEHDKVIREKELREKEADEKLHIDFFKVTNKRVYKSNLRRKVSEALKIHEMELESRQQRLRELLTADDEKYRQEATAKEPTLHDRIEQNKLKLQSLRDRKEKERQTLCHQKLLQQACLNHEELRTMLWKRLELEADADRKAQMCENKEKKVNQKKTDGVFHEMLMADHAARMRREEDETIERHRANEEQLKVLLEQLATAEDSKELRRLRIAEEAEILKEQRELREKEARIEREQDQRKKVLTREMFDRQIQLAKQKREQHEREENAFILKLLEKVFTETSHENEAFLKRKRELNEEIHRYLAYLEQTRAEERRQLEEMERVMKQEMQAQTDRKIMQERLDAAARRRLLCDVAAVQRKQREEKETRKQIAKDERVIQRQKILELIAEEHRIKEEERRQLALKRIECRKDLFGQMDYNQRRRQADREEELRMWEKQDEARRLLDEEILELLQNPVTFKEHPMRALIRAQQPQQPVADCSK